MGDVASWTNDIFEGILSCLPEGSFTITLDAPLRYDPRQDDYEVLRAIRISPKNRDACSMELWLAGTSEAPLLGVGLDRWQLLAARIGVASSSERFVFGTEPRPIRSDWPKKLARSIAEARCEARCLSILGRLISAGGRLLDDAGVRVAIEGGRFGKSLRYEPY